MHCDTRGIDDGTALLWASSSSAWEVLVELLKLGADTGLCNRKGASPLHMAVTDLKMFGSLIVHGADLGDRRDKK